MGRITPFIAAMVVAMAAMAAGCKRERSEPVSTPKTTEPAAAAAAQDEAESALEAAREAKATAESALETAREAQAVAAERGTADETPWWSRGDLTPADRNAATPEALAAAAPPAAQPDAVPLAIDEADRISVAGRVTESAPDRVVVEPVVGTQLAARIDAGTSVTIDGRAASPAELRPGTEVRLLYRLDGAQVIAERLDVRH